MVDDVPDSIAQFTNMYAEQNISRKPSHADPNGTWLPTDKAEIEHLIAILSSHVPSPYEPGLLASDISS